MDKTLSKNSWWLIGVMVVGLIAVFPQIVYQPFLLQGDHGRDLYFYQLTAHGVRPHIDFTMENGPLMPYYYALFLNGFGENINSVLIGYALLILLNGMAIFWIAGIGLPKHIAALCSLWYWAWRGQEFFYTFNHIGALLLGLTVLGCAIRFSQTKRRFYIIAGFIAAVGCFLIRPNIGAAAFWGLITTIFLFKGKPLSLKKYLIATLIGLAAIALIIPAMVPFQNLIPWFEKYWHAIRWQQIPQNFILLWNLWFGIATQNNVMIGISSLLTVLALRGLWRLRKTQHQSETQTALQQLGILSIFFILFLLEFLVGFRFFRWVWVMPIGFLILFHLLYYGLTPLRSAWQNLINGVLVVICLGLILGQYADLAIAREKGSPLTIGGTRLYLQPNQSSWIKTVTTTTTLIQQMTTANDKILTLPYDALYCFLSQRYLAGHRPYLFGCKDADMTFLIEHDQIKLIVISNRAFRHNEEALFGTLGTTYGKGLWQYIQANYLQVSQIGPWEKTATPTLNHATRIYIRKTPFSNQISK